MEPPAALSSLPGVSPAASSALPAAPYAPEKLRRTCRREKIGAGKARDAGGLTPTKERNAVSADFSRRQACCLLLPEGTFPSETFAPEVFSTTWDGPVAKCDF